MRDPNRLRMRTMCLCVRVVVVGSHVTCDEDRRAERPAPELTNLTLGGKHATSLVRDADPIMSWTGSSETELICSCGAKNFNESFPDVTSAG
jgi:hypothetical protein